MNRKDLLARAVIDYYAHFPASMREDILHTQEVVSYTRLIAAGEGEAEAQIELLECAAWLHDVGCPRSKEIYGNSLPVNQQNTGREVARQLLSEHEAFSASQKEWLIQVVGTHHQYKYAVEFAFSPLFEADLIANVLSGYHKPEQAEHLFATLMKSTTGRALFRSVVAKP
ncbi:MAG: HD domain-containing protein [Alistipes sp.]|nr:HD domain-containing protein [Alistipes sp.]